MIYIECRSKFGVFGFDLECAFVRASLQQFNDHKYFDNYLIEDIYAHYDAWSHYVTEKQNNDVINYMVGSVNVDINNVNGNAAAVGSNAQANNTQITQINNIQDNIDPIILLESLLLLREEMRKLAIIPEEIIDTAKIAEAEIAVKKGDISKAKVILSTAGKWTYDIATKLGIAIVVKLLT